MKFSVNIIFKIALLAASHFLQHLIFRPCLVHVNLNTNLQAVAIRIQMQSLVIVCSLYLPPSERISQTDLNNLISQLPSPFIILGDLNGHSPFWGSTDSNSRGLQIEQPLRGTSSLDVTGFTTPRYPSVYFSFRFCLPLSFFAIFFFPSRVGEGALHEKQLTLCLLRASHGQQITPTCWPCVATH
ncbi:hypothetical protein AVEN_181784-1 [Araneus ventricosus]|uniref:Endonuclease/exonuclease/phosphatase domain-containing protein n=1 Tax=Araneus ventricosus TaxID=182803 RepID=A0A4Y2P769_ARAVE|nr:hypothetical protein AVEN_181784-1 [Araneus ventricosus]